MKRPIITALLSITAVLLFEGCCPKPNVVYVPQKCNIPPITEPTIDKLPCDAPNDTSDKDQVIRFLSCTLDKALYNYVEVKKYGEKLLRAQEVCK